MSTKTHLSTICSQPWSQNHRSPHQIFLKFMKNSFFLCLFFLPNQNLDTWDSMSSCSVSLCSAGCQHTGFVQMTQGTTEKVKNLPGLQVFVFAPGCATRGARDKPSGLRPCICAAEHKMSPGMGTEKNNSWRKPLVLGKESGKVFDESTNGACLDAAVSRRRKGPGTWSGDRKWLLCGTLVALWGWAAQGKVWRCSMGKGLSGTRMERDQSWAHVQSSGQGITLNFPSYPSSWGCSSAAPWDQIPIMDSQLQR